MIATTISTPTRRILAVLLAVMLATFGLASTAGAKQKAKDSKMVDQVVKRGTLRCGISGLAPGFSLETDPGVFEGFDVDMCRVVAVAVLGDADAVEFVPLGAVERFSAVADGTVDVLMRTTTNTLGRDAELGVNFGPTTFYDGQGIMVDTTAAGLVAITENSTIADLPDGTDVCLIAATTSQIRFMAAATAAGKTFNVVEVGSIVEAIEKLELGDCDVTTTDRTALTFFKENSASGADWVILNQLISKEPLAPVVAEGDDGWLEIVRWSVNATIFAEEAGVTSTNIDDAGRRDSTVDISAAFGVNAASTGAALGLDSEWGYRVIKEVGNYGEIYADNLEPVGLARAESLNDSYLDGGLIYAPPIR